MDPQKDSFFPSLRHIFFKDMQNLKSVCKQPLLFPSLKEVFVNNCPEYEKLPFQLTSAPCLEVLQLLGCNKMVEIIGVEELETTNVDPQKDSFFPSLRRIFFKDMQNLKSVCKQPLLFPSLKEVFVNNCPEYEKLPFQLTSAPCLEVLQLLGCNKMVEIIGVEELETTNVDPQKDSFFPSLRRIFFKDMQNLKSVCKQPLLFPSLKEVFVNNCPEYEKLPFQLTSAPCLEVLQLLGCNKMVEIIGVEELETTNVDPQKDSFFPSLRRIFFKDMQNLKSVCKQPLLFPSLKEVIVKNCPKYEKLPFELGSAPCLEVLQLLGCNKMVEIIGVEELETTNVDPQKDSFFHCLICILLENMPNLKSVCKQPLLFPSLKEVIVKNCPKYEKLPFELGSAPCLELLELVQCNKIKEIIGVEELETTNVDPQKNSFFPSLRRILFKDMQNLKSVCKQPLLFPSLKEVIVKNCPEYEKLPFQLTSAPCLEVLQLIQCNKIEEIIGVEELETTNVDPQKDSFFPSLRCIFLENMQNLKSVCKQPLLFPSLKEVIVKNCPKYEKLPFELGSAPCLELLELVQCNKIKEIIGVEELETTNVDPQKDSFFPSLRRIFLENMQNLKSVSRQSLLFPSLKEVIVKNCPEYEKLPFELMSAPCLEVLHLIQCNKIEEIIGVEELETTNVDPQKNSFFPSLRRILFKDMQNLKSVCKQPLLFPSLKEVIVKNCPEYEKLPFQLTSAPCLEVLLLVGCNKMVEIIGVEELETTNVHPQKDSFFPCLIGILLENMQNLKSVCKQPLLFPSLKEVFVSNCPEYEKLPFELGSAPCLEDLQLVQCNKIEEIIGVKELETTNVDPQKDSFFPSLRRIFFKDMQNLKSVCKQPLLFPSLKEVFVNNCPELEKLPFILGSAPCLELLELVQCNKIEKIIGVEELETTNVDPQKDSAFPILRRILFENMQNLKSVCKQPLLFPSLKEVFVNNCPEYEKLPFELISAPCLEVLVLVGCNKIVEIIGVEELETTNVDPQKDSFFHCLICILLENMPNLKSVCKKTLLFPSLEVVIVNNCPEYEKLPFELGSAPCLEYLQLVQCNKMAEIIGVEELETTNVDPQKDSFFRSLRHILFENMQNLKSVCRQRLLFPSLKEVRLHNCPELEKLPFELRNAPCLEFLQLVQCNKMEEIIGVEELETTNVDPQKNSFLPHLREIVLKNMQNLKNICGQPLLFPSLKKVFVKNCPELEKLSFELKSTTCLEILELYECPRMVEIIIVEESKTCNVDPQKDSCFPSLRHISLENMKNLKRICKQPLSFPMLKGVNVRNCPEWEKLPFEHSTSRVLALRRRGLPPRFGLRSMLQ